MKLQKTLILRLDFRQAFGSEDTLRGPETSERFWLCSRGNTLKSAASPSASKKVRKVKLETRIIDGLRATPTNLLKSDFQQHRQFHTLKQTIRETSGC